MPKANLIQTNFTTGEVSPIMRGRVDTTRYANGADTIENFVVRAQGGLWRRNGTEFVRPVKFPALKTRVQEFEFSNIQGYVLEIGDGYIRILDNEGNNLNTPIAISSITSAGGNKILGTGLYAAFPPGTFLEIYGVIGSFEVNRYLISHSRNLSDLSITVSIPSAGVIPIVNTYVSGGFAVAVTELVSPYQDTDLDQLSFAQSADVLYIFHPKYQTRTLSRLSATSFVLNTYDNTDGPYMGFNDNVNYQASVTAYAGSATLYKVSGSDIGLASPGDLNKYIEFKENDTWKLAKITAVTDTNTATVDIVENLLLGLDASVILGGSPVQSQFVQLLAVPPGSRSTAVWHPSNGRNGVGQNGYYEITTAGGANMVASIGTLTSNFSSTFTPYDVGKIVRISSGAWVTITSYTDDKTVSYSALTLKAAASSVTAVRDINRTNTLTMTRKIGTAAVSLFATTDVGRHVRLSFKGQQAWGIITAYTSASVVTMVMQVPLPRDANDPTKISSNGLATSYKLGAWSETTGWPSLGGFQEQRLVLARTNTEPQSFWMSVSGDFTNHSPTEPDSSVVDDNAINYAFASNKVNSITWLAPGPVLLIGTIGGEWQVKAASTINEPITPANINATIQSEYGSIDNSQVVKIGHAILIIQRTARKVIELTYDFTQDSWIGKDVTVVSEHVLRNGGGAIREVSQRDPNDLTWFLLSDGTFACLTYMKDQEVIAWHRHDIGGIIESVCSVLSQNGTTMNMFMVVNRTVNGSTVRYIEMSTQDNYPANATDRNGFFHVDCGIAEDVGVPLVLNVWFGALWHLVGQTVQVLKNGVYIGSFVVGPDGSVDIGSSGINVAGHMAAGLQITSTFKSLSPEGGSPFGTSQGKFKRVDKLDMRIWNSISVKHGSDLSALTEENFNEDGSLFSGDKRVNLEQSSGTDGSYYLVQDKPYPLIILAVMPHLHTQE